MWKKHNIGYVDQILSAWGIWEHSTETRDVYTSSHDSSGARHSPDSQMRGGKKVLFTLVSFDTRICEPCAACAQGLISLKLNIGDGNI